MSGPGRFPLPIVAVFVLLLLAHIVSDMDSDLLEDFPLFAAIAAFVLFRVLSSHTESKKRGSAPEQGKIPKNLKDLGFKIPELRGAPKDARIEAPQAAESAAQCDDEDAAMQAFALEAMHRKQQRQEAEMREQAAQAAIEEKARMHRPSLTPDALRNAVILSEILAPPKALRKKIIRPSLIGEGGCRKR